MLKPRNRIIGQGASSQSEKSSWTIGPISIDKSTSFASLVALLLSIATLIITIKQTALGSQVLVFSPSNVGIYRYDCLAIGDLKRKDVFQILMPLVLNNVGEKDTASIIDSVSVSVKILNKTYRFEPVYFAKYPDKLTPEQLSTVNSSGKVCDTEGSSTLAIGKDFYYEVTENFSAVAVEHNKPEKRLLILDQAKLKSGPPVESELLWFDDVFPSSITPQMKSAFAGLVDTDIEFLVEWSDYNRTFLKRLSDRVFGRETLACKVRMDKSHIDRLTHWKWTYSRPNCRVDCLWC